MGILKRETNRYPNKLFDLETAPERRWWVGQTHARQEKKLARYLLAKEIPFYLPLASHRRKISGHVRTTYNPLFVGYVFFQGDLDLRAVALASNTLVNVLDVPDTGRFTMELHQLDLLLSSGTSIQHEPTIRPGTPVRIRKGSLMGLEGTVMRVRGEERVVIAVTFMNQGASVQLSEFDIEPI